ncbi:MAG: DUF1634 domain-containing protein [Acidimicrobiales bacterium]
MSVRRPRRPSGGHPLIGRQRHLLVALRVGVAMVALLAVAGLFLPGEAGRWASTGVVVALIAIPTLRVTWLAVRWIRRGDRRFAAVALAVLGVLGLAGVIAVIS